jgi:hypothetical protein
MRIGGEVADDLVISEYKHPPSSHTFPVHDRGQSGPGISGGKEGNPGATGTLGQEDNT